MLEKLKDIAEIKTGQTFREKVLHDPNGKVLAIQVKDLSNDSNSIDGQPHRISIDKVSRSQLLNKGDILFLGRGVHNKAFVYSRQEQAVAASFFMIIQVDQKVVNPFYLAWFINQKETQAEIQRYRQGTATGSIMKSTLEELTINLPPMLMQIQIAKLDALAKKEEQISKALIELKKMLLEQALIQQIKI